jgi:tetratricopeptide (TPR) repeat protein
VHELFAADIEAHATGGDPAGATAVDPEQRERLAALGYVGGSASRPGDPRIDPKDGIGFIGDLDRARERLQRGDPKEAGLLATRLLSRNPQNLPARLVLAQAQLAQGDTTAALATLDDAIARAPDDPLPRFQRGNALRRRGASDPDALEAAAASYREALARHPRHAPSVYALASLTMERGDLAGTCALLEDAERRGVADGALLTLRGAAEAARGRGDAADAALARALALDPSSARALEGRGQLAYARGDARAAASFYRQALAVEPSAALARTLGAILWFELKDAAGARAALQQALALEPAGPDADEVRALLAEIR